MKSFFIVILTLFIPLVLSAQYETALDSSKLLTQFLMKTWTTDEGMPSNATIDIIQSKQGYIWLATYGGLSCFDGKDFINFDTDVIEATSAETIIEDKDGVIWVGTHHGIFIYKNKQLQRHPKLSQFDKIYINELYIAKDGSIWIGTNSNGFFLFRDNKITNFNQQLNLSGAIVHEFAEDTKGNIYIGCESSHLYIYKDEKISQISSEMTSGIFAINITSDKIWLGCGNGLFTLEDNKISRFGKLDVGAVNDIISDKYGLWLGTYTGLHRYFTSTGELQSYTEKQGFPNNIIRRIVYDKNGNLWVATYRKGIVLLSEGEVMSYSAKEGMSSDIAASIIEYKDGEYWMGIEKGEINILKNKRIVKHKASEQFPKTRLKSLYKDSKDNVWVSTYGALIKVKDDNVKIFNKSTGLPGDLVRLTYEDKKGQLWIGTRTSGLHIFENDVVVETIDTKNGLSSNYVMCISEDRKGKLYVGTKSGINIIENNKVIKKYSIENGLASNLIFNIYADSTNTIWVLTSSGLCRIRDDKIFLFTSKYQLLSKALFDILEDKNGYFWIPSNLGIAKVHIAELNAVADGKMQKLHYEIYDKSRGIRREECVGATKSLIDHNGKLWILTTGGVVNIDPNTEKTVIDHEVIVEKIISGDKIYYPQKNGIKIFPGQRRIQIKYTTFEYITPLQVVFKYKLEPFDKTWVEAGNERIAPYTNLPPGKYVFRVIHVDENEADNLEAIINIEILPFWYETLWFKFLVAFVFIGIGFVWYKIRVYSIKKQNIALEKQVKERTYQIREKNKQLIRQKNELNLKNQKITDSIQYAKRIQDAVLPSVNILHDFFSESFILFKPRNIVSGDFYWFNRVDNQIIIAAADCTGHGVPGAFMSLLSIASINEIVNKQKVLKANAILNNLRNDIKTALRHEEGVKYRKDGLDIAVCIIDIETLEMQFAGAYNPLFVVRKKEKAKIEINRVKYFETEEYGLTQVLADPMPIGVSIRELPFTNNIIQLLPNDSIYLFSDGFSDQLGGDKERKFMIKQFRDSILKMQDKSLNDQQLFFDDAFKNWKGDNEQTDDILIIGLKI